MVTIIIFTFSFILQLSASAMNPTFMAAITAAARVGDMKTWEPPKQASFVDKGVVLRPGTGWDKRLTGAISPCTVIKKNGIYYLYYIGSSGDRETDGGPAFRSLGVATSLDGINFTKYEENPILTFLPRNNPEEGIFSATTTLDKDGNIVLFFSGVISLNSTSEVVRSSGYVTTSKDGIHFSDPVMILDYSDKNVWGYGDELFPVGVLNTKDNWYIYYITKSIKALWRLGVLYGSSLNELNYTKPIIDSEDYVLGASTVVFTPDKEKTAIFLVRTFETYTIEARYINRDDPTQIGEPVQQYNFPNDLISTVFLDKDNNRFLIYYTDEEDELIKVMEAPVLKLK